MNPTPVDPAVIFRFSKRAFGRLGVCALGVAGFLFVSGIASANEPARRGSVAWARMITPHVRSSGHVEQDGPLAEFLRKQTSLDFDPAWRPVTPDNLEQLCGYPFIYVKELTGVTDPKALANIREYLGRGGFLFIDPCTNGYSWPERHKLAENHVEFFKRLFPDCEARELPDDHELYHVYFSVSVDDLFTPDMIARGAEKPPHIGLRGIFREGRMIALISVNGLECGWPHTPQRMPGCIHLIVNAYVYAMIASPGSPGSRLWR